VEGMEGMKEELDIRVVEVFDVEAEPCTELIIGFGKTVIKNITVANKIDIFIKK
jgi:hypothetical protein